MRPLIALCATAALVALSAPGARAAPAGLETAVQALEETQTAFVKKGWKGGKGHGWGHHKVRRGPPPWAPAYGYRYKRKHRW